MGVIRSLCSTGLAICALLATAVPSNASVLRKRDPNCDTGLGWAPVLTVGGTYSDAVYACETSFGHDHTPVSAIEVWRRGDKTGGRIAGIQFTYASGVSGPIYGHVDTAKYPSSTLTMIPGEIIKNAELFGDGRGTWLGSIHIETSKQTWDAGASTDGHNPYQIATGSGLLFGANIYTKASDEGQGSDIASMSLLFLGQPLDHIAITDITFTNDPSGSNSGISPSNVVVGEWYNAQPSATLTYNLAPTYAVSDSYTYSQSVTTSFGQSVSVEISGELFGIGAKATNEFTWGVSVEVATTVGTTSSTAIVCGATGTLAPSQGVQVTGSYQTGKGIFDYTSKVTIFLKDRSTFSYTEKGVLTNIAYNICHTSAQSNNDAGIVNSPGLSPTKRALANLRRGPMPTPKPRMPRL